MIDCHLGIWYCSDPLRPDDEVLGASEVNELEVDSAWCLVGRSARAESAPSQSVRYQ